MGPFTYFDHITFKLHQVTFFKKKERKKSNLRCEDASWLSSGLLRPEDSHFHTRRPENLKTHYNEISGSLKGGNILDKLSNC